MRFPLTLATSMATYIAKKKISGEKRFPLVLMLEPLHACNLTCTGCGRIREYSESIKEKLTVEECLDSVDECDRLQGNRHRRDRSALRFPDEARCGRLHALPGLRLHCRAGNQSRGRSPDLSDARRHSRQVP